MILQALLFACFYWGWRLIKKCSLFNVIIFAVCGAFLFNTKVIGAWFFGIIGLYALFFFIFTKQFNKYILGKGILCILVWFGVYVFITPACWSDLIGFFEYILSYAVNFERWKSYILYHGKLLHTEYTGIPRKYLPTMMLLTIPVGILLLIAWGYLLLTFDFVKSKFQKIFAMEGYIVMIAFAGLVPLAYAVLARTPVYNGWRHFYFVYSTMIICAGYGVHRIQALLNENRASKILHGCGIAYVGLLFVSILINHPQEHSYYNWLAGNGLENYYELDYWDMSVWQAYEIIYGTSTTDETISVSTLNVPTMWGLEGNWTVLPQEMKEKLVVQSTWENADYIIINTTYANMYSSDDYNYIQNQYELIEEITSYGNTICEIYKIQ